MFSCSYCGSLEPMSLPAGSGGTAHALFVSKDRRIPKIRINTRQLQNLLDMRIVVAVDSWDRQSRYPSGHYVRPIGKIGDKETETEVRDHINLFDSILVGVRWARVGKVYWFPFFREVTDLDN